MLVSVLNLKDYAKSYNQKQTAIFICSRNGIPEYWVIDLLHNKLWLFTNLQQNSYLNKQEITTGKINSGSFPNISIDIDKLLLNKI